jgi:RNA polymerase sigma-70 factor (ECF subfamily)
MTSLQNPQDELYNNAVEAYGPALVRLARAWEADSDARQDLLQEMHLALWRSFRVFDARCGLRTWVYRVAQNASISHVVRSRKGKLKTLVSIEEIEEQGGIATGNDGRSSLEQTQILDRLYALIQRLNPLDRQVILLYLEGIDAATIGEVTGITPGYVATKIHRIKSILADRFHNGGDHDHR